MQFLEYFLISVVPPSLTGDASWGSEEQSSPKVIPYPHPNSTADDKGSKTPSLP